MIYCNILNKSSPSSETNLDEEKISKKQFAHRSLYLVEIYIHSILSCIVDMNRKSISAQQKARIVCLPRQTWKSVPKKWHEINCYLSQLPKSHITRREKAEIGKMGNCWQQKSKLKSVYHQALTSLLILRSLVLYALTIEKIILMWMSHLEGSGNRITRREIDRIEFILYFNFCGVGTEVRSFRVWHQSGNRAVRKIAFWVDNFICWMF